MGVSDELAEMPYLTEAMLVTLGKAGIRTLDDLAALATDELAAIEGINSTMLVTLGEKGVKTLDDLADLAGDELIEMLGKDSMTPDEANAVIMAARAHWFEGEGA